MLKKLMALMVAIPLGVGLAAGTAVADPARPILAGVVHGEGTWTYADGHFEAHTADLGLVVAVGGGSITLIRPDRVRVTMPMPDTTCVRINGYPAGPSDLHVGMRAVVFGQKSGDGSEFARVVRAGAPLIRWSEPTCGLLTGAVHGDVTLTYRDGTTRAFSVDRGSVGSVGDGELVIQRPDGSTVTTTTDDSTKVYGAGSVDELQAGQAISVVSERIGDALIARLVRAGIGAS